MREPLIFIFEALSRLYLLAFLLRFILHWVRADFYNPFAQSIVKITNPLIVPVRRFVPSSRTIDVPALVVLLMLEAVVTWVLVYIAGGVLGFGELLPVTLYRLISLALWFYFWSIIIYVVLSWIGQRGYNPVAAVLSEINEPLLRPFRRIMPSIAGLDLSPLVALLLLQAGMMVTTNLLGAWALF
ncbi:MAG: YggT family protein [Rhodospirillaceae bacterium]|nr:YggT family protein [Rhodospirillaceae bacterium]